MGNIFPLPAEPFSKRPRDILMLINTLSKIDAIGSFWDLESFTLCELAHCKIEYHAQSLHAAIIYRENKSGIVIRTNFLNITYHHDERPAKQVPGIFVHFH